MRSAPHTALPIAPHFSSPLPSTQVEVYDQAAGVWREVRKGLKLALRMTGTPSRDAMKVRIQLSIMGPEEIIKRSTMALVIVPSLNRGAGAGPADDWHALARCDEGKEQEGGGAAAERRALCELWTCKCSSKSDELQRLQRTVQATHRDKHSCLGWPAAPAPAKE